MEDQVKAAWEAPKNPDGVGRIYIKADERASTYEKVYPVLEYMNKTDGHRQQLDLAIAKDEGQVAMGMSAGGGKPGGVSERDQRHAADRRAPRAAHHLPRRDADHDEDGDAQRPAEDRQRATRCPTRTRAS